jgi:hypothetical protein
MILVIYVKVGLLLKAFRLIIQSHNDFFNRRPRAIAFKKIESPFVFDLKEQAILRQNEIIPASARND